MLKLEVCLFGVVPTAAIGKHFLLLLVAAAAAMRSSSLLGLVGSLASAFFSARGDTKAKQRQV